MIPLIIYEFLFISIIEGNYFISNFYVNFSRDSSNTLQKPILAYDFCSLIKQDKYVRKSFDMTLAELSGK